MQMYAFLPLLAALGACMGYKHFQDKIPNGNMVPHPCKVAYFWQGVGHNNPAGRGARNAFGEDFDKNEKIWDTDICGRDSDGDGKTNGEELGDPNCVWKEGQAPELTHGLSHPGVCEPVDSALCLIQNKDSGDFCDQAQEVHPCIEGVKNQVDVRSHLLSYPEISIPGQETTNMCQVFQLPANMTDADYHIIAAEPDIVNAHIVHHIIIFACVDEQEASNGPVLCSELKTDCTTILFPFNHGVCLHESLGFRIGMTGYKKIYMNIHYHNPELRSDYTDSSGFMLYYTPNLRPHDGGMLGTAQFSLAIPPGQMDYVTFAMCDGGCTSKLNHSIFFTEAHIHMHYLGSKAYIEHYRNGVKMSDLFSEDSFTFDYRHRARNFDPVEFRPGDSIKTVCHYKSTSRSDFTHWGDSSNDEMCIGWFTYYPKSYLETCTTTNTKQSCNYIPTKDFLIGACNVTSFEQRCDTFYYQLISVCDITGSTCYCACQELLNDLTTKEPCLKGEALVILKSTIRARNASTTDAIVKSMESCDNSDVINTSTPKGDNSKNTKCSYEESNGKVAPKALYLLVALGLFLIGIVAGRF